GRKMPEGWLKEDRDGGEAMSPVSPMTSAASDGMPDVAEAARVQLPVRKVEARSPRAFHCPEHDDGDPLWRCRFCVAQMIVDGELEPVSAVRPSTGGFTEVEVPAHTMLTELKYLDSANASKVDVYVRAATFTRKLSR